jgi:CMP-N-acetylneuraminic acid synthetase
MEANRHDLETIVIIPARGGSRGIKRKNLRDLGGIPLLAHSILAAKASTHVNRIVVSTDDEDIADTARRHGAEVPFLRPTAIAGDRAIIGDAVQHVLDELKKREGYDPNVVATMYPTHPFRTPALVDTLLGKIDQGYKTVITVRPIALPRHRWCSLRPDESLRILPPAPAGPMLWAHRPYGLFTATTSLPCPLGVYLYPLRLGIELIDIDDPEDLRLARHMLRDGIAPMVES